MGDDKKIEKLAGDAMENYRVRPPGAAKDKIKQRLREQGLLKRSGRGYVGYFVVAGLIAVLVTAGIYLNGSLDKNDESKAIVNSESVSQGPSVREEVSKTNDSDSNEPTSEEKIATGDNKTIAEKENTGKIKSDTVKQKSPDEKTVTTTDIKQNESATVKHKSEATRGSSAPSKDKESIQYAAKSLTKNKKSASSPAASSSVKNKGNNLPDVNDKNDYVASVAKPHSTSTDDMASAAETRTLSNDAAPAAKSPVSSPGKQETKEPTPSNIDNNNTEQLTDSNNPKIKLNENTPTQTITEKHDSTNNVYGETSQSTDASLQANTADGNAKPVQLQDSLAAKAHDSTAINSAPVDTLNRNPIPRAKRFSLDVYAGPQFSTASYETSSQSDLFVVQNAELLKTSLYAAVRANIQVNRFIFSAGAGSTSIKSKFFAIDSTISVDTSGSHYNYVDTTITVIDSTGDTTNTTIHLDSTWVSQYDTSVTKSFVAASNSVSYIEIPLMVGYRFSFKKFDFEARAGAAIAFLNKVKSTLISPTTGEIETYSSKSNSPFRNSYWSFLASVTANYNFSNRVSIFLQPSMKIGLNSIYKDSYPLSKKIRTNSIFVGLRCHF